MKRFEKPRLRSRIGSAHAISLLALVIASGGTAYAAATIGSEQVIDNSLRSVDIRNETLRSADVRNGTLGTSDISANAREELRTKVRVDGTMVSVAPGAHVIANWMCDYTHGERATGGGGYAIPGGNKGYLTKSVLRYGPLDSVYENEPVGWEVGFQNLTGDTINVVVRVLCVKD